MIGISYHDFWGMNPHIFKFHVEQYKNRRNEEDLKQWQLGQYMVAAIACNFSKNKYPEKPMFQITKDEDELSENEIQKQRKLFIAKLQTMKTNFETNNQEEFYEQKNK